MVTKKEVKAENPLEFKPDDLEFLSEYKITDQGYHAAWDAAASRNPPNACVEPQFRLVKIFVSTSKFYLYLATLLNIRAIIRRRLLRPPNRRLRVIWT